MKKIAILCVDDEAIILLSLVQELKSTFGREIEYEQALNADAALKTLEELVAEGIDVILIISDWLMPGIKGDKFLEIVYERYPKIRSILITGNADAKAREGFKKLDSLVAVFTKPWERVKLTETIQAVLNDCK
ncbi:response regulator [Treponema sp.]